MTNRFMEIEMLPSACGAGGTFATEASFALDNFQSPFYDVGVKIDTGCSLSTIPLKRLNVSDTLCKVLKSADIVGRIPYYFSYGVESGGLKHAIPITDIEKMDCPAIKFEHKISCLTIGGVKIPNEKICLNYDRKANILIGMDILKNWDIHMGISKITGKNLFLASPFGDICEEYSDTLKLHFGISLK